ncbi:lysozyme inhibitor LprI family protein [Parasphingopyxis sp.]|uniref:lysozyme inhibitor LprI family protein n=1 Tax=Parasphingopyxis sp. TaxID=1920299 RepID=UPI00260EEBB9|nr:lysozyme inhibitor LprI family protein [Parasphingopyxis sp.]
MLGLTLFVMMQFTPNAETCADSGNLPQQHMNACAYWDFRQADGELNAVYEQVIDYARGNLSYMPDGDTRPSGEERIRRAQRAWITLRDEHCEAWSYHMIGGSAEPLLFHGCRAQMTRERTEELRALMIEDQ